MPHEPPDHEQVQSVLDKLSRFLSDWVNEEGENRKSAVLDSVQYLPQLKGLLLFARKWECEEGCPYPRGFHLTHPTKPHSRALEEPVMFILLIFLSLSSS